MLKSSSHREVKSLDNQHSAKKSIGCMSGLFHFFSRHHHSHSRKRLASAGKREKPVNSPVKPMPSTEQRNQPSDNNVDRKDDSTQVTTPEKPKLAVELRRHSCVAPRSPTLPQEIRRSRSDRSPSSPRQQPALVARLMGLEEGAPATNSPESAAEKRRKLLGALEKCDEDLKALKRIIDAVRLAETQRKSVAVPEVGSKQSKADDMLEDPAYKKGFETVELKKCLEFSCEQQPSPVSVLDAICSPRGLSNKSERAIQRADPVIAVPSKTVEPLPPGAFFLGNHFKEPKDSNETSSLCSRILNDGLPQAFRYNEGKLLEQFGLVRRRTECSGRRWRAGTRSDAMVESVGEVWEDGVWGERWELGRVGVGLEVDIFGDLLEEVVVELQGAYYKLSLPLRTCGKRLRF